MGGAATNCCGPRKLLSNEPCNGVARALADAPTESPNTQLVAREQCQYGDQCRRADPWHWCSESHPGDRDWHLNAPPPLPPCIRAADCLPACNDSYEWIRDGNDPEDRTQRCAAALSTLLACRAKGYVLDGSSSAIRLRHIDAMLAGTRLVTSKQFGYPESKASKLQVPRVEVATEGLALDAALARAVVGTRIAIINAASSYHPCGGFRTGGRHAFEESMCVQTTLSLSLQHALWLSQQQPEPVRPPPRVLMSSGTKWFCYIPEDGVVLSPSVELFRGSYTTGYQFCRTVTELTAVVSVAMPNRNPNVRDCPLDAPTDVEEYRNLLCAKFSAALAAAGLANCTTVIMSAIGCGVYRNDPREIGRALGRALCSLPRFHGIQEVVLVGVPAFFVEAVREQLK